MERPVRFPTEPAEPVPRRQIFKTLCVKIPIAAFVTAAFKKAGDKVGDKLGDLLVKKFDKFLPDSSSADDDDSTNEDDSADDDDDN